MPAARPSGSRRVSAPGCRRRAVVLALVLAGACGGGVPGTRSGAAGAGEARDSIAVVIDNRNYLDVTVRIFSDDRQVSRHFVVGNTVDTVHLGRDRFLGGSWFRAVLSPVGRRRDYPLPRELLPDDASLILIDVSEHLP